MGHGLTLPASRGRAANAAMAAFSNVGRQVPRCTHAPVHACRLLRLPLLLLLLLLIAPLLTARLCASDAQAAPVILRDGQQATGSSQSDALTSRTLLVAKPRAPSPPWTPYPPDPTSPPPPPPPPPPRTASPPWAPYPPEPTGPPPPPPPPPPRPRGSPPPSPPQTKPKPPTPPLPRPPLPSPPQPSPPLPSPPPPSPTLLSPPQPSPTLLSPPQPSPTLLSPPQPSPPLPSPPQPSPTLLSPPRPSPPLSSPPQPPPRIRSPPPRPPSPPQPSTSPGGGPPAWTLPKTADAFTSYLWGVNGERWNPAGRLTDYSYAGYMGGNSPLPQDPVTVDVRSYGAVGDGSRDDTAAFLAALDAVSSSGGVIFIPPGRYALSQQIVIQQSGVVLRGAGADSTTLYFTRNLTALFGQAWSGYGEGDPSTVQSDYKDGPGLIRFAGPSSYNLAGAGKLQIGVDDPVSAATLLTRVTAPAQRGDTRLYVSDTSALRAGQFVTLALSDADSSLLNALYGYIAVPRPCSADCINQQRVMRFHSAIFAVRSDYIVLERPLPWDVSLLWSPEIHAVQPGIQQSGIEEMTIEFKHELYAGHLREAGWNGVEFAGATNCWAKNLVFLNSDNPLIIWKSSFLTATGLTFGITKSRGYYACHHNVNVTWSQDILVTQFRINQKCVHDISSFAWNNAIVYSNGAGANINLDHHLLFPYATLWSNIHLGVGDRAFANAGEPKWGMAAAALTTYYNIYAAKNISSVPSITNGPFANFLRIQWNPAKTVPAAGVATQGWLLDQPINPPAGVFAAPVDLHAAMVRTRATRFVQLGREAM